VICEENRRVWSPPPENVYIFDAQLMTAFLEFSGACSRVNAKTVLIKAIFVGLVTAHLCFKNCTNGFRTAHFV
jgi:hypothetical protein